MLTKAIIQKSSHLYRYYKFPKRKHTLRFNQKHFMHNRRKEEGALYVLYLVGDKRIC